MIAFVAPLTLALGAGLFSAGLLSFFDIHFFNKRSAARAAFAGGLALLVLTEFIFAASGTRFLNGQRSDLLECRLEAETALPNERHKSSLAIHAHVARCMNGFGYEWTMAQARCREEPVSTNPYCYLPKGLFDRAATELQMMLE
ncbi:MAG TPA: hypothetical protein VEH76_09270 [Methylocystis sp.]|nr:hypothetical protein [Methylocystis sp.]